MAHVYDEEGEDVGNATLLRSDLTPNQRGAKFELKKGEEA